MVNLNPDTLKKMVSLLTPLIGSERDRHALLAIIFGSKAPILTNIDYSGTTNAFATYIIGRLADYGEITPGKQALWVLLEVVREQVGIDKQVYIDNLHDVINVSTNSLTAHSNNIGIKTSIASKFEYALDISLSEDEKAVIQKVTKRLSLVSHIRIKKLIKRGKSASTVLLVDVDPVKAGGPQGPHYLKIDPTEYEITHPDRHYGSLAPSVSDQAEHQGWRVTLYKPAHGTINTTMVTTLAELLDQHAALAKQHIINLAERLYEWNPKINPTLWQPYNLLVYALGKHRASGNESVQARMRKQMGISDQSRRILFSGEVIFPNPLAFLSNSALWQSEQTVSIVVPFGHVHGDLQVNNVIVLRDEKTPPDIIDFADYQSHQLIFFDWAYLELSILLHICQPERQENRTELLRLVPYLMSDIGLNNPPPGGTQAYTATDLLRPLRRALLKHYFDAREDDFECAFWLAATAVGLNFARKLPVDNYTRLLGLFYAAAALKNVLDYQELTYESQEVPNIPWFDATTITSDISSKNLPTIPEQFSYSISHTMTRKTFVTPIRVFISSSEDLTEERRIITQAINDTNHIPRHRGHYKLVSYSREDNVSALSGASFPPQKVINEFVLDPSEADILICVVGFRMDTLTKNTVNPDTNLPYQSRTEYEFFTAYRANEKIGKPLILLYKYTRPPKKMDDFDPEQYERVRCFFARFEPGGDLRGYVAEIKDEDELRSRIYCDLEVFLDKKRVEKRTSSLKSSIFDEINQPIYFLPDNLPSEYVERESVLNILRKSLLSNRDVIGLVSAAALHGQGGLGKTVLARAICEDSMIRSSFHDGILWATLGENADPVRHQRNWINALEGNISAASNVESGKVELRRLLERRAMLLIIDDVWKSSDLWALSVGGPRCATLITTRNSYITDNAVLIPLSEMAQDESRSLLKKSSKEFNISDQKLDFIASRMGNLPLALKITGALLSNGIPWDEIELALKEGDIDFFSTKKDSISLAISASVNFLSENERERYKELVIFPRDEALVTAVVKRYWNATAGLRSRYSIKILCQFRECALLQTDNTLHDLQHDYLNAVVSNKKKQELHALIVNIYGLNLTSWCDLPEEESLYVWRNISNHLAQASHMDKLYNLLTNYEYLKDKIYKLGSASVLKDFLLLADDKSLSDISESIRLGSQVLNEDSSQLANQIYGRVGKLNNLHNIPTETNPHIRLISKTLTSPNALSLSQFKGHTGAIFGCAFSPNGQTVLSASVDHTLRLWDIVSGKTLFIFQGHTNHVHDCTFTSDGHQIVSASRDGTLKVWDAVNGRLLRTLEGHANLVGSCTFSLDGKLLLSASDDRSLRLWDFERGQVIQIMRGHKGYIRNATFDHDCRRIVSASDDGTLRVWDVVSGQVIHTLEGHSASVRGCAFSPDGRLIASASKDFTIRLWNAETGQSIRVLEGHTASVVDCAFSPDSKTLISVSWDRTVRLWNVETGKIINVLRGHTGAIECCSISPDAKSVISGGWDCSLKLWELDTGRLLKVMFGSINCVRGCAINADSSMASAGLDDGTIQIWSLKDEEIIQVLKGHTDQVRRCKFSPDGTQVLSCSADNTVRLWNLFNGQTLRVFEGHTDRVRDCAFSPEGDKILSASWDGTLRLWDKSNGKNLQIFYGHDSPINCCDFSPSGMIAVSGSWDCTLRLWDIQTGQVLQILKGHINHVRSCVFTPDGKYLLSAGESGTLRLWEISSGDTIFTLHGHSEPARDCAISPDGQFVISASSDFTLRLWNIPIAYTENCDLDAPTEISELTRFTADAALTSCAIASDAKTVVTGDTLGHLHFLELENICEVWSKESRNEV